MHLNFATNSIILNVLFCNQICACLIRNSFGAVSSIYQRMDPHCKSALWRSKLKNLNFIKHCYNIKRESLGRLWQWNAGCFSLQNRLTFYLYEVLCEQPFCLVVWKSLDNIDKGKAECLCEFARVFASENENFNIFS